MNAEILPRVLLRFDKKSKLYKKVIEKIFLLKQLLTMKIAFFKSCQNYQPGVREFLVGVFWDGLSRMEWPSMSEPAWFTGFTVFRFRSHAFFLCRNMVLTKYSNLNVRNHTFVATGWNIL